MIISLSQDIIIKSTWERWLQLSACALLIALTDPHAQFTYKIFTGVNIDLEITEAVRKLQGVIIVTPLMISR
jgi:uncharacterized protein (DUF4213/DUF364 family)